MKQEHDFEGALEAFEAITDSLTLEDFVQGYSREIRAALTAAKWRPIESAPKDGNKVLVYNGQTCCAYYNNGWMVTGGLIFSEPTHWMPIPKPPQDGGDDAS